jgi:hypothetical protein
VRTLSSWLGQCSHNKYNPTHCKFFPSMGGRLIMLYFNKARVFERKKLIISVTMLHLSSVRNHYVMQCIGALSITMLLSVVRNHLAPAGVLSVFGKLIQPSFNTNTFQQCYLFHCRCISEREAGQGLLYF